MTQIILSESQWAEFQQESSHAEVCDPSGRVVAICYPIVTDQEKIARARKSPFTEEEIRRRATEPGGMSLQDFWRQLKAQYPT